YADLLGSRIRQQGVKVWLINTGWSGGPFGKGSRINLAYTRAMITAVLANALDGLEYRLHPVVGVAMPLSCPGVPTALPNPRQTWPDTAAYDEMAGTVAGWFITNFEKYASGVSEEILKAGPTPGTAL